MRPDYYKILGLEKSATDAEIKQAYRRLAMKYHPDRNPDDTAAAEAEFKKIKEAHEVLADPARRRAYDSAGFAKSADYQDIFADIFGNGFNPFNHQYTRRQAVQIVEITLADAYTGRTITIDGQKISIPAGIRPGSQFELNGRIIRIEISPHSLYKRANDDLLTDVEISSIEAMLGVDVVLEHLNKSVLQFTIPPGIQYGQIVKLSRHGMPNPGTGVPGDLLVRVSVVTPQNLTDEQKEEIRRLFSSRTSIDL